jgi:hypothetical protein
LKPNVPEQLTAVNQFSLAGVMFLVLTREVVRRIQMEMLVFPEDQVPVLVNIIARRRFITIRIPADYPEVCVVHIVPAGRTFTM